MHMKRIRPENSFYSKILHYIHAVLPRASSSTVASGSSTHFAMSSSGRFVLSMQFLAVLILTCISLSSAYLLALFSAYSSTNSHISAFPPFVSFSFFRIRSTCHCEIPSVDASTLEVRRESCCKSNKTFSSVALPFIPTFLPTFTPTS